MVVKRKILICMDGSDHAFKAFSFYLKHIVHVKNDEVKFVHVPILDPSTDTEDEEEMAAHRLRQDRFTARIRDRCTKMSLEHLITAQFVETKDAYPHQVMEPIHIEIREWCPDIIIAGQRGFGVLDGVERLGRVVAMLQYLASAYNIPMQIVAAVGQGGLAMNPPEVASSNNNKQQRDKHHVNKECKKQSEELIKEFANNESFKED